MSMSLRLSEEAVSGSTTPSPEACEFLQSGDIAGLIAFHRDRFGGWKMEKDDDDDSDDDDDDSDDDDDDTSGDDDDDDSDDDADDDDDDDDDADDEDGPEGKKSKKQQKAKKDSPEGLKRRIVALEDEKDRHQRVAARVKKERDDALAELEKVKKDAPGDDDLKQQAVKDERTISTLSDQLQSARLQIAFLSDNTYEWVNPGQALKLADLDNVEIDDDGKVLGLVSALEALAESSPHLLKQKTRRTPIPTPGGTGKRPAKKSASKKTKATEKAIKEKYKIGGAASFG